MEKLEQLTNLLKALAKAGDKTKIEVDISGTSLVWKVTVFNPSMIKVQNG